MRRGGSRMKETDRLRADVDLADSGETLIDPRDASAYLARGNARYAERDLSGAIEDFTRAVEIDPRDPEVCSARGWARYLRDEFRGARFDFEKVLEVAPPNWPYRQMVEGQVRLPMVMLLLH
mgnify:CR=1 FL=1